MPNETVVRNSIKIFSSKYMSDLSSDLASSYVLNLNLTTTFTSDLKRVFEKDEPLLLEEPEEDVKGTIEVLPKGLKSILACISRTDESTFSVASQKKYNDFHIVANCYDPSSNNNYIGYYLGFCRVTQAVLSGLSDITKPLKVSFTTGVTHTALGAFDAFNVTGTNSANQEITFNFTPVQYEGNYVLKVFKDDVALEKGTDYSEDSTKVTVFSPVPTMSKITLVYIYNP